MSWKVEASMFTLHHVWVLLTQEVHMWEKGVYIFSHILQTLKIIHNGKTPFLSDVDKNNIFSTCPFSQNEVMYRLCSAGDSDCGGGLSLHNMA